MKRFDLKTASRLFQAAVAIGLLLFLIGALTQVTLIIDIGVVLAAVAVGFRLSYFHCPYCRYPLKVKDGDRCPHCGKKLTGRIR